MSCRSIEQTMQLHRLAGRSGLGLARFGCIWPQGRLRDIRELGIRNEAGQPVVAQSRVTAYYKDGSVKWTAHLAEASRLGEHIRAACEMPESDEYIGVACEMPESDKYISAVQEMPERLCKGAQIRESARGWQVSFGDKRFFIGRQGCELLSDMYVGNRLCLKSLRSVLLLECREERRASGLGAQELRTVTEYTGEIRGLKLEENGPLCLIVKLEGIHTDGREQKIPFVLRISFHAARARMDFQYTFLYDGNEAEDFLKGIGLRADMPARGEVYNRHLRFLGDAGSFSEAAANLLTWRPRIPEELYERQCAGEPIYPEGEALDKVNTVIQAMPFWDRYEICQDSDSHFSVKKKQRGGELCYLDCLHGQRAAGGLAVGSEHGGMMLAIRDFWQSCPSGYSVTGLCSDELSVTGWYYAPGAEAFDFRHYAERGYNQSYYEGYDFKGASAYGIAVTSESSLCLTESMCASEEALKMFTDSVQSPAVYVGTPEYYHSLRAFGFWSLPARDTGTELWLETQLEGAVDFYRAEVEQRRWYGLFNYGDFMHSYDSKRHMWRYDMGGYAWDNTELVPTLWLWLMFLRSGRAEIFELAEKLSRHSSEVDVYHFGPYKGMGSRHNVRHWGCPCKEARIAMAAHHRYYYYMTGDYRMEDIFDELKDNEYSFLNKDPLGEFYDKEQMLYPSHARSGPDWSSLCANWMTQWERSLDTAYLEKIMIGSEDIKEAPLQLVSGPDFEFDPESKHLRYIGERTTGGTHLQICMGAPSVWMEMAEMLDDDEWRDMLADYGRFYYLPEDKKQEESRGLIGEREFSLPFMAAAMGAYGAWRLADDWLAEETWRILLHVLATDANTEGFEPRLLPARGNQAILREIPWISTNFTAQWCLNVIMALDFIRAHLPRELEDMSKLLAGMPAESWRRA